MIALAASFADGAILVLMIYGAIGWVVVLAWRWGIYWFRMWLARRLAAPCFERRRLRLLRFVCGRGWAVWGLSCYAIDLMWAGRYEDAVAVFDEALRLDPSNAENWRNRAESRWQIGRLLEAEDDLTKAIALDRAYDEARAVRGCVRTGLQKWPEALEDLTSGVPHDEFAWYCAHCRGYCHENLEQWREAYEAYVESHRLNEAEYTPMHMVARLQAACPEAALRNGEKAVENARRVCVQTNWEVWETISVLAAAYAELGDFESAIQHAEMALDLAPEEEKERVVVRIEQFKRGFPARIDPHETHPADKGAWREAPQSEA